MSNDEGVRKEARIVASVGSHRRHRPESIIDVARRMKADLAQYSKTEVALKYDLRDPTMVNTFLGVLKLPPDIQERVSWGGPLGLDKAYRVSKLVNDDDKRRLVEEIFKSSMSTLEVRHVLELKHKNHELAIDEVVKLVRSYRPVINEVQVLVIELTGEARRALETKYSSSADAEKMLRERVVEMLASPGQLRGLTVQHNHVTLVLTQVGFSLLSQEAKKAGLNIMVLINGLVIN